MNEYTDNVAALNENWDAAQWAPDADKRGFLFLIRVHPRLSASYFPNMEW